MINEEEGSMMGPVYGQDDATRLVCPHCGVGNRPAARFCQGCGKELEAEHPKTLEQRIEFAEPVDLPDDGTEATAGESPVTEEQHDVPPADAATEEAASPDAAPSPLEVEQVIGDRYRVLEVLVSAEPGTNLYAAADLKRCWSCDWTVDDAAQPFCTECGADVTQPPPEYRIRLQEIMAPADGEAVPSDAISSGERLYELLPREPAPAEAPFPQGVRLSAGQASDAGKLRDLDEDSVFVLTLTGLYESEARLAAGIYVVADGIGGHEGGEWASRLAAQSIAERLLRDVVLRVMDGDVEGLLEEAAHSHLCQAIGTANERLFEIRSSQDSDMGTTVTMALVLNDVAYIANVGDSRTYLWAEHGLEQVTFDHSVVASLIAKGMAQPEEIYTHPQRNAIYRSLGGEPTVQADVFTRQLTPGSVLVLCSDGLWEMIHDEGIEEVLLLGLPPQATCDELLRRANLAGGEDNISVVVVRVEDNR
jgi:serine/threonine protein phosphatase PrpC